MQLFQTRVFVYLLDNSFCLQPKFGSISQAPASLLLGSTSFFALQGRWLHSPDHLFHFHFRAHWQDQSMFEVLESQRKDTRKMNNKFGIRICSNSSLCFFRSCTIHSSATLALSRSFCNASSAALTFPNKSRSFSFWRLPA